MASGKPLQNASLPKYLNEKREKMKESTYERDVLFYFILFIPPPPFFWIEMCENFLRGFRDVNGEAKYLDLLVNWKKKKDSRRENLESG